MVAVSAAAVIVEESGSQVTLQYVCLGCGQAQPGTLTTTVPSPGAYCDMNYRCCMCGRENNFRLFG